MKWCVKNVRCQGRRGWLNDARRSNIMTSHHYRRWILNFPYYFLWPLQWDVCVRGRCCVLLKSLSLTNVYKFFLFFFSYYYMIYKNTLMVVMMLLKCNIHRYVSLEKKKVIELCSQMDFCSQNIRNWNNTGVFFHLWNPFIYTLVDEDQWTESERQQIVE